MMIKLGISIVVLLVFTVWPTSVLAGPGVWGWDAPTEGGLVEGYEFQLNLNGGGWATVLDDPDITDTEYPYTIIPGSLVQGRVRAFNVVSSPILDEDGLLIGTESEMRFGIWSDLSDVYDANELAPGGCASLRWLK